MMTHGEVGEQEKPSSGLLVMPRFIIAFGRSAPLRSRNGIQAMAWGMIPEVQNGIAHSRNSTVRTIAVRTWNTRNQAMLNPTNSVTAQTIVARRNELT